MINGKKVKPTQSLLYNNIINTSKEKAVLQFNTHKIVGRVALIPTSAYIANNIYRSIKTLYTNIFCLYRLFIYTCLCRDEGNPTYGFYKN